jgi:fructan beta-fructosidase
VRLGDTLLYKGNGYLADSPDKVHWWSHLDISEAVGSKDELTLEYHAGIHSKALDMITTGDDFKTLAPLYDEDLRPQLRFSQRFGWNNDPNGMQYYDGEYHLFFQSNPFGIQVGQYVLGPCRQQGPHPLGRASPCPAPSWE